MKNVSSDGSQNLGGLTLAQAVPPHPSPLPRGEGEPFAALRPVERFTLTRSLAAALPLPKGEGWGEGERDLESSVTFESAEISATTSLSLVRFSRGLMHRSEIVRQRVRRRCLKRSPAWIANSCLFPAR